MRIRILFACRLIAYEVGVAIFNELFITYEVKLIDFSGLLKGMRSRLRDNTPGSSCGDVFLKTQFSVEFCIRIRFLKRKNPLDTLIKKLSKRTDLRF